MAWSSTSSRRQQVTSSLVTLCLVLFDFAQSFNCDFSWVVAAGIRKLVEHEHDHVTRHAALRWVRVPEPRRHDAVDVQKSCEAYTALHVRFRSLSTLLGTSLWYYPLYFGLVTCSPLPETRVLLRGKVQVLPRVRESLSSSSQHGRGPSS